MKGKKISDFYVYLGNDVCVPTDSIIGIFDIERVTVEKYMNEYLTFCQKNGKIYYVSLDMPKSIVICSDIVYITNVSCSTLKKRI